MLKSYNWMVGWLEISNRTYSESACSANKEIDVSRRRFIALKNTLTYSRHCIHDILEHCLKKSEILFVDQINMACKDC